MSPIKGVSLMEIIDKQNRSDLPRQDKFALPMTLVVAVLAAIMRLVRWVPNFAPLGGLAIFGGARLRLWQAISVQLGLLLVTDGLLALIYGPHYLYASMPFVYGSFLIYVLIGRAIRSAKSPLWIGVASLIGSVQFFLISNFGEWIMHGVPAGSKTVLEWGQYYLTPAGLFECYTQALPFFRTTLLSDLLFTAAFFGLHAVLTRTQATRQAVPVQSFPGMN
jgi:hypothetical protein